MNKIHHLYCFLLILINLIVVGQVSVPLYQAGDDAREALVRHLIKHELKYDHGIIKYFCLEIVPNKTTPKEFLARFSDSHEFVGGIQDCEERRGTSMKEAYSRHGHKRSMYVSIGEIHWVNDKTIKIASSTWAGMMWAAGYESTLTYKNHLWRILRHKMIWES